MNDQIVGTYYNNKKKKELRKKKKNRNFLFFSFFLTFILFAVIIVSTTVFLNIETIEFINDSLYSDDQILSQTGIVVGQNILKINSREIEKSLVKTLPYIRQAKITWRLPSKLIIKITADKAAFAVENSFSYLLFDDELKLLDQVSELNGQAPVIIGFQFPDVAEGEKVSLADLPKSKKAEDKKTEEEIEAEKAAQEVLKENRRCYDTVNEIYAVLESKIDISEIQKIDVSNQLKAVVTYNNRFEVDFGNTIDMERKTDMLVAVLKELNDDESGVIKLSGKNASFIPYDSLKDKKEDIILEETEGTASDGVGVIPTDWGE